MKPLLKRSEWINFAADFMSGYLTMVVVVMSMIANFGLELSGIPVAIVNSDMDPKLSELFLASLPNSTIVQSAYANLEQAKTAMERQEVLGIINIAENFSTALRCRFAETGESDESPIYIDFDSVNDNREIGFVLQKIIFDSSKVSYT